MRLQPTCISKTHDLVADQNGNVRVREHLIGNTSKQSRRNSAPPVRGHNDEIAALVLCSCDDRLIRVMMFYLSGFARNTSRLSRVCDMT